MEEGKCIFSCSDKKEEEEKRFLCQCADQRKGGAEGKLLHRKEVTHSECQFCNRARLDFLAQCNFSTVLWFCTFSCANALQGYIFLSMFFCCILRNLK